MVHVTRDPSILADENFSFVDMHHHSTVSDGKHSPEFIAKAFSKSPYGLCMTDHNTIRGSVYLAKNTKLLTIPSIEVTSKEAKDVLIYFYHVKDLIAFWEKEIKDQVRNNRVFNLNRTTHPILELLDIAPEYNGEVVLAHPYGWRPKHSHHLMDNPEFARKIRGIETHNFSVARFNKTLRFARPYKKAQTAGSDSHQVSHFTALTGAKAHDTESFLQAVMKRKSVIYYKQHAYRLRWSDRLDSFRGNVHWRKPQYHLKKV